MTNKSLSNLSTNITETLSSYIEKVHQNLNDKNIKELKSTSNENLKNN